MQKINERCALGFYLNGREGYTYIVLYVVWRHCFDCLDHINELLTSSATSKPGQLVTFTASDLDGTTSITLFMAS